MTSSRLPGKVLLRGRGQAAARAHGRAAAALRALDAIVIATTEEATSDPIEALADRLGIGCFRGSEDDVLARVLGAAQAHAAD